MKRFTEWGHWGIGFWEGERGDDPRAVANINFPVGACGPCDGFLGSPERERWRSVCRAWVESGELPDGAKCDVSAAWLYDDSYPGARWVDGSGWQSPIRSGHDWVYP